MEEFPFQEEFDRERKVQNSGKKKILERKKNSEEKIKKNLKLD